MTLIQDVQAAIPGLRETMPGLRDVTADLRDATSGLREAMPDTRAAMPAIRKGVADLRSDLPGPWRKERPSLVRRAAIVVAAAIAVTAMAWGVGALLGRRRLESARARALQEDRQDLSRAENEGMGTAVAVSVLDGSFKGNSSETELEELGIRS